MEMELLVNNATGKYENIKSGEDYLKISLTQHYHVNISEQGFP